MAATAVMPRIGVCRVQGPPPPPPSAVPPPPPPPTPVPGPPVAFGPPPRRRGISPIWWVLGCGCLLLIVLVIGALLGGVTLLRRVSSDLQAPQQRPLPPATEVGTVDEPVQPAPEPAANAGPQPGKQEALKAALGDKKNWVAKVNYASADWQRVKVWIGPPASEFVSALVLQWDDQANLYRVQRLEAIPGLEPPAVKEPTPPAAPKKPAPPKPPPAVSRSGSKPSGASAAVRPPAPTRTAATSGPRPGRQRALRKCLAQAPASGWVARVTGNNGDFTECSVMIGPPASEFVTEFDLRWVPDRHNYAIVGRRSIGN